MIPTAPPQGFGMGPNGQFMFTTPPPQKQDAVNNGQATGDGGKKDQIVVTSGD